MREVIMALLSQPNEVVVNSLPKARLMNKLLLVKITLLTLIAALLFHFLADWNYWMVGAGIAFVAAWTFRGWRRDVHRQNTVFATEPRATLASIS